MVGGISETGDLGRDRLLRRGLKLSHLRLLAALERSGQISAAAAQLAISQPAASRLMAEAERIVGAALHQRLPRGIALTEAGRHIATAAQRMLSELDGVDREIAEIEGGRRGLVSIGAVTGAALEHVLPVLRQMRVTQPRINANVVVDTSDKLAPLLLAEELDFYIGRIPRRWMPAPSSPSRSGRNRSPSSFAKAIRFCATGPPRWSAASNSTGSCNRRADHAPDRRDLSHRQPHPLPARVISTSSTLMTLALIAQSNAVARRSHALPLFSSPIAKGSEGGSRPCPLRRTLP